MKATCAITYSYPIHTLNDTFLYPHFRTFSQYLFAQNSQTLFSRTNFDAWKSEYSDNTYQVYVDLFKASQLYVDNKDFYEEGYLEQHITLMDFDRDGLDDIVFEGFLNGGESEHVVFLHRSLFGLEKIFDVMGYVTEVSHPSASNLQLTIKHYGCCDNVITNIEQYTLVDWEICLC